jgi:hypothetical protein
MNTHLTEDDLVLHYYGEMDDSDEAHAAAHLRTCEQCHASYRRLQRVLAAVDEHALAIPELPAHFERTVWARLEPGLDRGSRGWRGLLALSPQLALAASVVLLVAAAFYAGRMMPRESAPGAPAGTSTAAPVAASAAGTELRERILLVDLNDHLEQSQMVLVELVAADDQQPVAMSDERKRAEELVAANRLYRQTAVTTGDNTIADLLDELERVLVDVAASPERVSAQDLDDVRRRIHSSGLLFKVRVLSSEVRQRQRNMVRERVGQRSSL